MLLLVKMEPKLSVIELVLGDEVERDENLETTELKIRSRPSTVGGCFNESQTHEVQEFDSRSPRGLRLE